MALDPTAFRDSTQIVLPSAVIEDIRADLEACFRLTLDETDDRVRIIASPAVIKEVGTFLARRGIHVR